MLHNRNATQYILHPTPRNAHALNEKWIQLELDDVAPVISDKIW